MKERLTMLRRTLALVSLAILVLIVSSGSVHAQPAAGTGQALEISPPLIEKSIDPGKVLTFSIRIRNITKATLITHATVDDFVAGGEDGQAKVLIDEKEPSPYSFKTWVQDISDLTLVAGEAKTATVTFNVPDNAAPGGHYGLIRFTGSAPELAGTGVSLNASLGSLVLLNVSGKVTYKASLLDLYAAKSNTSGKASFFEHGPITFVERLQNQGSVHFKPIGTLRITNIFGKETAVLSVNPNGGNVLPASTRRFEEVLNKKFLIGKYTVEANIQYNGQTISKTISFWVIPYKQIAIVLGMLIILFAVFRTSLKKYVKRAVSKASNPSKPKHKK
jgi:hypothetical protein